MGIFVRPFKASDLDAFEPVEPITEGDRISPELAEAMEKSDLSVTGIRNGEVVACGGVHPTAVAEQGELWLRLSKVCLEHRMDTLTFLIEGLKIIEKEFPFKQLNAIVRCDFGPSIKLVKFLGFKMIQKKDEWLVFAKRVKA